MKCLSGIAPQSGRMAAVILAVVCTVLVSSCGKRTAPEVPRVQPELLVEIMNDLETGNYDAVLPKVRRYQTLEETNPFLHELGEGVITNLYTVRIGKLLEQGKFSEAKALADEMLKNHDARTERMEMKHFLETLNETDRLLVKTADAMDSESLRKYAGLLMQTAKNLPSSGAVTAYAKRRLADADALEKLEAERRYVWLYFDALDAMDAGDQQRADFIAAFLAARLKNGTYHPMVQDLMKRKTIQEKGNLNNDTITTDKKGNTK